MVPLFQNNIILNIDSITLQELWRNTRNQIIYHSYKDDFHLVYSQTNKTQICFFLNKKIEQSSWTFKIDSPDIISLYIKLPER